MVDSMPIVCPHCATSYAVDSAKLGPEGRAVRCARCKEVWLARPDSAMVQEQARMRAPAMATDQQSASAEDDAAWGIDPAQDDIADPPHIDSPSIAGGMPAEGPNWAAAAQHDDVIDGQADETPVHAPANRRTRRPGRRKKDQARLTLGALFNPRSACVAMAALVAALFIWRTDIVRLMPQTAAFYKTLGFEVNLRGLAFKDIKLSNEVVDGKSVMVIEGNIVSISRKPAELPRMRFVVRDAKGTEIYAWNAMLEKEGLNPGDTAWFKSRLAAPPPEGATLDIRFFTKRDIAGGAA